MNRVNLHVAMSALVLLVVSIGLMQVSPVSSTTALLPFAPSTNVSPATCPYGQHWDGVRCVQNAPSTSNTYYWYRSTGRYAYGQNFPYRLVFFSTPYYYYILDAMGNLESQVQTLESQLRASQSDRDQAIAQAQQMSAQIESLNQQVNDLNKQMNNANIQYASQLSNLQSQAANLQSEAANLHNSNQALQANLDTMRTQNNVLLAIVALLGAVVVIAVLMKRS